MVDQYANCQHWRAMLPIRQSGSEWSHFKVRKPKKRVADLRNSLHQSVTKAQRNSNKGFRVHMTDLASRIKVEEFVRGKKGNRERARDHGEGIIIKAFMLYSVLNCGLQKITLSVVWFNKAGFGGECIIGQEKKGDQSNHSLSLKRQPESEKIPAHPTGPCFPVWLLHAQLQGK